MVDVLVVRCYRVIPATVKIGLDLRAGTFSGRSKEDLWGPGPLELPQMRVT